MGGQGKGKERRALSRTRPELRPGIILPKVADAPLLFFRDRPPSRMSARFLAAPCLLHCRQILDASATRMYDMELLLFSPAYFPVLVQSLTYGASVRRLSRRTSRAGHRGLSLGPRLLLDPRSPKPTPNYPPLNLMSSGITCGLAAPALTLASPHRAWPCKPDELERGRA